MAVAGSGARSQGQQEPEPDAEGDGANRALMLGRERDLRESGLLLGISHPDRLRACGHV
jgi:hypothetical protein